MSERRELGKILAATFGCVGYQDCELGLHLTLGNDSWGVTVSESFWDANLINSKNARWSEADRDARYTSIMRFVSGLLAAAKVSSVDKLVGKPVEVIFEDNTLKDWRVLTEVI